MISSLLCADTHNFLTIYYIANIFALAILQSQHITIDVADTDDGLLCNFEGEMQDSVCTQVTECIELIKTMQE